MLPLLALLYPMPLLQQAIPTDLPPPWSPAACDAVEQKRDNLPSCDAEKHSSGTEAEAERALPDAWAVEEITALDATSPTTGDIASSVEQLGPPVSIVTAQNSSGPLDQVTLARARARLRDLGLLANADDTDNGFAEAIRRFQGSIKVQETGNLDRDTLGRLLSQ